jgi:hypothetical protein
MSGKPWFVETIPLCKALNTIPILKKIWPDSYQCYNSNNFLIKKFIMKQISFRWGYKIFLAIFFTCMQVVLWAQESNQSVTTKTTETTTTEWYSSPWVWVAGGAVFIIILVALMRGNSSTSETRTTVIKDNV